MSAWIGWAAAAYFAGALALVMADEKWHLDELAALAVWPLSVPFAVTVRKWRRWRSTCRICGRWYGTRERLLRHVANGHSDRLPAPKPARVGTPEGTKE